MLNLGKWSVPMGLAGALLLVGCGGSDDDSKHGAIAYSPSTTYAVMTWNYDSQAAANGDAFKKCGNSDCTVVLEFTNCGAIAGGLTPSGGFVYGVASGPSREQAQVDANNACNAKGGNNCLPPPDLKARCAGDV